MHSHVLDMGCLQTRSARFRHVRFGLNSQEIAHGSIELQECGFLTVGRGFDPAIIIHLRSRRARGSNLALGMSGRTTGGNMVYKGIRLDFSDVDQTILLFCAFRYALGRSTYVVGTIADIIGSNWDQIVPVQREMYKREIREAIDRGRAGMDMDVKAWEKILKLAD